MNAIRKLATYVHYHYFYPVTPGEWAQNNPLAAEQEVNDYYGDWS